MSDKVVRNKYSKAISSLSMDKDDLKRLLLLLQERANAAWEFENKKLDALPDENYDKELARVNLKACSVLKVTVQGKNNKELFGSIDDVFSSLSFPEKVLGVYVHSEMPYRSLYNYSLENHFELFIDFHQPKVFDLSFQPSLKTPNNSEFKVEGSDSTWVNGVFKEIESELKEHESKFKTIHKGGVYDFLVWFLGIPLGFYTCHELSEWAEGSFSSLFIRSAFYVYVLFLCLFLVRILFQYIRWVYPMIEYKSKNGRSIKHQAALYSIIIGIIGKIVWDVCIKLFSSQ